MSKERWKAIPGYKGLYEVSSYGNVRSLDRMTMNKKGNQRRQRGKLISQSTHPISGYSQVRLYNNGKGKTFSLHYLVMLTFVGTCPLGKEICHNKCTLFKSGVHAHFNDLATMSRDVKGKIWLSHYQDEVVGNEGWAKKAEDAGFRGFVKKGQVFEF